MRCCLSPQSVPPDFCLLNGCAQGFHTPCTEFSNLEIIRASTSQACWWSPLRTMHTVVDMRKSALAEAVTMSWSAGLIPIVHSSMLKLCSEKALQKKHGQWTA